MRTSLIAVAALSMLAAPAFGQTATATKTETFTKATATDVLSSNLVGLNITNDAKENIGEIKDVVVSGSSLGGYIVSVGGFLGMGERYVRVAPSAVKITYSEDSGDWSATMPATKEDLKAAPEFKYEGRWKK